ncbi:DUF3224 domain-containing protein [Microbacteriaceae bacterium VKM Ac-2855]|nr:DUF3224 domain-containing protein [Microbacteriaceae bacterium VKM Ac-2855]
MSALTARFAVVGWEPTTLAAVDAGGPEWAGAVTMRKEFSSGIVGSSVAHFVSSGTDESRGYLAAERITGVLADGRRGAFTVHHGALQHPSDESAFGYIVPGTGTDDFAEFAGSARIVHDADGPYFVFDLA